MKPGPSTSIATAAVMIFRLLAGMTARSGLRTTSERSSKPTARHEDPSIEAASGATDEANRSARRSAARAAGARRTDSNGDASGAGNWCGTVAGATATFAGWALSRAASAAAGTRAAQESASKGPRAAVIMGYDDTTTVT